MSFVRSSRFAGILSALALVGAARGDEPAGSDSPILRESFEGLGDETPLDGARGWQAFRGFNGPAPLGVVRQGLGRNGSQGLAVSHTEEFRSDGWGVSRRLETPLNEGVAWMECYFHPPKRWTGGVYFDARGGRSVVARIGGERFQSEEAPQPALRVHASWTHSYWRMYRELSLQDDWYRLTMRLDFDRGSYAAWMGDLILGEELPLCSEDPVDRIYLGLGGGPDDPARVDDLTITRSTPSGRRLRALLPESEEKLQFRMAVIGDPQVGFSNYEADIVRFRQAVDQVNRSDAELTLIMGDMVHDDENEQAYRDVRDIAGELNGPVYYVRGNHDRLDLYQKYFHPNADFAFTHKGWRFVFLDAIGNQRGLTDEQLAFVEREFQRATDAGEEIVLCLHVSPWEDNEKGRGAYNQIGPGRDRLVELLDEHRAMFCLSGHYHRGLWRHAEGSTEYMVFPGTAQVKHGWLGWCVFDVYPDRVAIHEKPVYFGYVRPDAEAFYNFNYRVWTPYEEALEKYPYLQRGPAIVPRRKD